MNRKLSIYLLVKADTDPAMAWHSAIVIAEGIDDALQQAGIGELDELDVHQTIGTANDEQVPGVILSAYEAE